MFSRPRSNILWIIKLIKNHQSEVLLLFSSLILSEWSWHLLTHEPVVVRWTSASQKWVNWQIQFYFCFVFTSSKQKLKHSVGREDQLAGVTRSVARILYKEVGGMFYQVIFELLKSFLGITTFWLTNLQPSTRIKVRNKKKKGVSFYRKSW